MLVEDGEDDALDDAFDADGGDGGRKEINGTLIKPPMENVRETLEKSKSMA